MEKKSKTKETCFFGICFSGHALWVMLWYPYMFFGTIPPILHQWYFFWHMLFRSCFLGHALVPIYAFRYHTSNPPPIAFCHMLGLWIKNKKKNLLCGYQPINSHAKKNKIIKCNTEVLVLYNIQLYNMMNSFIKIKKYWIILKNIILVEHFILSGKKMSFIVFFACALWVHFH